MLSISFFPQALLFFFKLQVIFNSNCTQIFLNILVIILLLYLFDSASNEFGFYEFDEKCDTAL